MSTTREKHELLLEVKNKIDDLGLFPQQVAPPVLDAIKRGLVELCDGVSFEWTANEGAKVTLSFEGGPKGPTIEPIVYYLSARELRAISDGIDNLIPCER